MIGFKHEKCCWEGEVGVFDNIGIPTEDKHLQEPPTQLDQRSTHRCFYVAKSLWGNIHGPNQRGHLEQFINAKEKYYNCILQDIFSQLIIDK